MMDENFIIKLEARNPDKGNLRAYTINAHKDLFGHWFIHITYGRIGRPGRTVTYSSSNDQEAKQIVKHCLKRRSSAPKRIGVAYQVRELQDPKQWAGLGLS